MRGFSAPESRAAAASGAWKNEDTPRLSGRAAVSFRRKRRSFASTAPKRPPCEESVSDVPRKRMPPGRRL
jgi:hypothetical protein